MKYVIGAGLTIVSIVLLVLVVGFTVPFPLPL